MTWTPRRLLMLKRLFSLAVSFVVYLRDSAVATIRLLLRRPPTGRCTVLYYHEVTTAQRARFAAQLDVICRQSEPISALESRQLSKGHSYVAFTVDDAFVSFMRNGLREIEKRHIPIVVFVPTSFLGKNTDWAMEEEMTSQDERVVTLAELRELARNPLVRIGSHTASHRKLTLLGEAEARKELSISKEFLERELGCVVETISFPYGEFSTRDVKLASQLGYKMFFTTSPEMITNILVGGLVGRFRIDPWDWMLEVKLKAAGAYRWKSRLERFRFRLRNRPARVSAVSLV